MGKISGLDQALFIGGTDLSGDVGSATTLKKTIAEMDTTGLDKTAMERLLLLEDGEIGFANYFNAEDAALVEGLHKIMNDLPDADRIISHFLGAVVGVVTANLKGKQVNYDLERGSDGAINGGTITCKGNAYGLEWGYALSDGKVEYNGVVDSGAINIDVTATSKRYTRGTGSFVSDGFKTGDVITASGFNEAGNNGSKIIATVTPLIVTLAETGTLVDETGTGDEQLVMTAHVEDGLDGSLETPSFATGSDGVLTVFFHIFSITGGAGKDINIIIEDSDDDGASDPYAAVTNAETGTVDTNETPYVLRLQVDGPIKQWIRAKVETDSGYTLATFAVAAIRTGPAT